MKKFVLLAVFATLFSLEAVEYTMKFTTCKPEAFYKAGEKITFTAQLFADGKVPAEYTVDYKLNHNNKPVKTGTAAVSEKPLTLSTSLDKPGWVHLYCTFKGPNGKVLRRKVMYRGKMVDRNVSGGIGAMIEPEKIDIAIKEPADFDEFWGNIRKAVLAQPIKVLEKVDITPKNLKGKYKVYDMKVNCIANRPVSGYLIIPENARPKSLPVMVTYHGAGFRSSTIQHKYAAMGIIVFDVNAHGIPNGKSKEYYHKVRLATNKECGGRYNHSGKDDREKYFYKNVYMRVIRSTQFVKSLPEWDGKNLFINGGSQGGAQAIVAAALDPDVTMCRAMVPAMSDHSGCLAGRQSGWPRVYQDLKDKAEVEKATKTMAYYDDVFFGRRIKCPIYTCTGFIDTVCCPTSVYAFYNNLPKDTAKFMTTTPTAPHTAGEHHFNKALADYMAKIKK